MADIDQLLSEARTDADYETVVTLLVEEKGWTQRAARDLVGSVYRERNDLVLPEGTTEPEPESEFVEPPKGPLDHLHDESDDARSGPSMEVDIDAHDFLVPQVWGSYEDGEPLDLGEHGTFNPDGSEGIFSAKAHPDDPGPEDVSVEPVG